MTIKDIRPKDEIPLLEEIIVGNLSQPFHTAGWKHIKKDGSIIYTEISANDTVFEGKKARMVLAKDITHLKELTMPFIYHRQLSNHLKMQ